MLDGWERSTWVTGGGGRAVWDVVWGGRQTKLLGPSWAVRAVWAPGGGLANEEKIDAFKSQIVAFPIENDYSIAFFTGPNKS